jgi:hypothetical protein
VFIILAKHQSDYLYPCTSDVLGSWKHYNLSAQTMNERNTRAKSPLVSRELDRCCSLFHFFLVYMSLYISMKCNPHSKKFHVVAENDCDMFTVNIF